MGAHALLSPSASHRWLNCTSAPSLEAKMPDETSVYAEEGTLAHAICEAKLHELKGEGKAEDIYRAEFGKDWTEHELYKPEMEEHTDYYRDVVAEKYRRAKQITSDAVMLIEAKLDFSTWIPGGFGTADCEIIYEGVVDVIDFKYGKGVKVEAERNPQMMIYALGAVEQYDLDFPINTVRMTIIQPRIDNTVSWELPRNTLAEWGDSILRQKAEEAYSGSIGLPTVTKAGEWCKFCKVKAMCRTRAEAATELTGQQDPKLLSPEEIAELLPKARAVSAWCEDLEKHATALLLDGQAIEGYKIVEGRSLRVISNPTGLVEALTKQGFDAEQLYKPRDLKALGELERLVGKGLFAEIACDFISKPKGKPTLAVASDKRPAYSSIDSDFGHIIDNN